MAERKPLFLGGFGSEEINPTADSITLAGLTISSASGIAMGGFKITNLGSPTAATDAATKGYVDGVATGLDLKASVRAATTANITLSGTQTVDGVALVVGNRVLVKNQTDPAENGIYVVAAGAWSRSEDANANAEVTAGLFTFVEEGSTNPDTGWVLVTDDPIVVGTTGLTFSKFSSVTTLVYGAGLLQTGLNIDVELDTAANAQGAGNGGGSSGLEFDIAGDAGKLRAAVHATGGLERTATGLAVKIDDTPDTLDSDADGLKVTGLPSLFKINGAAVSANVTTPNVNTLVDGILSSADGLHRHGKLEQAHNVDAAVAAGDPVYYSSNDEVSKADAAAGGGTGQKVIGVTRTAQAVVGQPAQIVRRGPCAGVLSGATAGDAYWLASGGGLTATAPSGAVDRVLVGYAINATDLDVRIQFMGRMLA